MQYLKIVLLPIVLFVAPNVSHAGDTSRLLDSAISGSHRDPENTARDNYRHPKQTLIFFGLQANMNVLEILPGKGWYTEILAPALRDKGELTVASFGADHRLEYFSNMHEGFVNKLNIDPQVYNKVIVTTFKTSSYLDPVADGSMDMVVTFRNTHNWIKFEVAEDIYKAFYRVLKPGGTLGVVQHRAKDGSDPVDSAKNGYVTESYLIKLAEGIGFELVDKSELNANPKDIKQYPKGVWSLPPTYRLGEEDKEKYKAIGESDRMTLKFIKLP